MVSVVEGEVETGRFNPYVTYTDVRERILSVQEELVALLGKDVFTPWEIERLVKGLAPLMFMLREHLPRSPEIKAFFDYWQDPQFFIDRNEGDYVYVIYYKAAGTLKSTIAKDEEDMRKKYSTLKKKGYEVLATRVIPTPEFLKSVVDEVLKTTDKLGITSVKLPVLNKPTLMSRRMMTDVVREILGG